jgi:hypothetical protein
MTSMRNGFRIWLPVFLATLAAGGCRRSDLVENQLRARDVQYREALDELMRSEAISDNLRRENEALRAGQNLSPEQAAQTFGVRKIVIGRGTAGIDNDRVPGDEALQVWIEPRDASDHTIKAPGTLQLAVLEINADGQKSLLSTWDIDAERLRQSWKQGLLSIGYMIELPWKIPPRVETIRVVARFTLPDGRIFETDKDLKIRLMPGAARRSEMTAPESPMFRANPAGTPPSPILPTGNWSPVAQPSSIQQAGHWQAPPLRDAVQLGRPLPVAVPTSSGYYRPMIGEIRVED